MFHSDITHRRGLNRKHRSGNLGIFITLSFFYITLSGCQATPSPNATMDTSKIIDPTSEGLLEQYVIGVGDSLQISVWRNQDLSASVVVLPSGDISVPLVGDIKAAGSTTEQLADAISKGLDSFVRQPSVTVSVLSAVSAEYLQRVRITGAVNNPLSIPYRRGLTILDFVLQAGGLTPFANADRALLYRQEEEELKVYPVRLDDILAKGDLETNYALLPSDIITVPENSF